MTGNSTKEFDYSYLRDVVGHLAVIIFNRTTDMAMKHFTKIYLTTKEGTILEFIANNPHASQAEIAHETATGTALLVRILDGLTRRGMLEREPSTESEDGEQYRLTEEGQSMRQPVRDSHFAGNTEMLERAGLFDEETQELVRLLKKVVAGL